jgi:hypothetical protein
VNTTCRSPPSAGATCTGPEVARACRWVRRVPSSVSHRSHEEVTSTVQRVARCRASCGGHGEWERHRGRARRAVAPLRRHGACIVSRRRPIESDGGGSARRSEAAGRRRGPRMVSPAGGHPGDNLERGCRLVAMSEATPGDSGSLGYAKRATPTRAALVRTTPSRRPLLLRVRDQRACGISPPREEGRVLVRRLPRCALPSRPRRLTRSDQTPAVVLR